MTQKRIGVVDFWGFGIADFSSVWHNLIRYIFAFGHKHMQVSPFDPYTTAHQTNQELQFPGFWKMF